MQAVNQASRLVVNLTSSQDAPPCVNKCYYVRSANVDVGDKPSQIEVTETLTFSTAKLGVVVASGTAAVIGLGIGRLLLGKSPALGAAETADEAESSTEM